MCKPDLALWLWLTPSLSVHTRVKGESMHMHNKHLSEQGYFLVVDTQQTKPTNVHTWLHANTHSSFFLLAPQAVSHPSIHVTERWVHPVTGQLEAVSLIYVAPLSLCFSSDGETMYARSLLGRFTQLVMGGLVWELSQTEAGRRAPAWGNCMMA